MSIGCNSYPLKPRIFFIFFLMSSTHLSRGGPMSIASSSFRLLWTIISYELQTSCIRRKLVQHRGKSWTGLKVWKLTPKLEDSRPFELIQLQRTSDSREEKGNKWEVGIIGVQNFWTLGEASTANRYIVQIVSYQNDVHFMSKKEQHQISQRDSKLIYFPLSILTWWVNLSSVLNSILSNKKRIKEEILAWSSDNEGISSPFSGSASRREISLWSSDNEGVDRLDPSWE